jgi:hypothetical protein
MKQIWTALVAAAVMLPLSALGAQEEQTAESETAAKTPAEKYQALSQEYQTAYQKWLTEARAASQEGKAVDMASRPDPQIYAAKFMALAEECADDPVAEDALFWVASNVRRGSEAEKAITTLFEKYPESKHIGNACSLLSMNLSESSEKTLRKVIETHPVEDTQAQAAYALARMYKQLGSLTPMLADEERLEQFRQFYGDDSVNFIKGKDADAISAEVEKLFETLASKYGEVKSRSGTFGELAKRELFEIRNLSVGCEAPDIVAEDVDGVEFKLSDYRGKVVLLDFWGDW